LRGAAGDAGRADLARLRAGQTIVGFCDPLTEHAGIDALAKTGATLLSMELMPRITRAQSMDALSSMATIAGYKAVLLAGRQPPQDVPDVDDRRRYDQPGEGPDRGSRGRGAAGDRGRPPTRRGGRGVRRPPAVKEQIQSLGAKFVELDLTTEGAEDQGGYAKAQDDAFYRRQRELMARSWPRATWSSPLPRSPERRRRS